MVSSWSGGFHPESCNWRTSNGHWMLVQYFTGNSSNSKHLGEEALEVCGQFPVAMVSARVAVPWYLNCIFDLWCFPGFQ